MQLVTDETITPEAVPKVTPDVLDMLDSVTVADSASVLGMADKLAPLVNMAEARKRERVEHTRERLQSYQREAKASAEKATLYKQRAKNYARDAKQYAKELKAIEREKVIPVDTQKIVDRLRKHKALQYVKMSGDKLHLYYKPTYTMAQIEQDSKERVRMFVGCFLVTLTPGTGVHIRIKNLTFPQLGHWTVNSGGEPCWGSWQDTIRDLWQAGDVYGLVTTLAAYLASNEDEAGYSRTYRYRPARPEFVQCDISQETFLNGERAIYAGGYTDNSDMRLRGLPFEVTPVGGSSMRFLVPVDCHNHQGSGDNHRAWHAEHRGTWRKLTEAQQAELTELLDSDIEIIRSWGESIIENYSQPDYRSVKRKAISDLLTYLDTADSLPYAKVAQPLKIKISDI